MNPYTEVVNSLVAEKPHSPQPTSPRVNAEQLESSLCANGRKRCAIDTA
jgi:hypothetical protein